MGRGLQDVGGGPRCWEARDSTRIDIHQRGPNSELLLGVKTQSDSVKIAEVHAGRSFPAANILWLESRPINPMHAVAHCPKRHGVSLAPAATEANRSSRLPPACKLVPLHTLLPLLLSISNAHPLLPASFLESPSLHAATPARLHLSFSADLEPTVSFILQRRRLDSDTFPTHHAYTTHRSSQRARSHWRLGHLTPREQHSPRYRKQRLASI